MSLMTGGNESGSNSGDARDNKHSQYNMSGGYSGHTVPHVAGIH